MRQLNHGTRAGYLVLESIIAVVVMSVASVALYSLIQYKSKSSSESRDFLVAISALSTREKEYRYLVKKPKVREDINGYLYKIKPIVNKNGTKTLVSTVKTKFGSQYTLTTFVSDIIGSGK